MHVQSQPPPHEHSRFPDTAMIPFSNYNENIHLPEINSQFTAPPQKNHPNPMKKSVSPYKLCSKETIKRDFVFL